MSKIILVFGATGVQGRALIQALSKNNTPNETPFRILALSRDPNSSSSQYLSKLPGVKVLKVPANCMDEPAVTVFKGVLKSEGIGRGDIHGVFSCQGYVDDKAMVKQGKAIADAAHESGVKHIVYSSSDFGNLDNTGIASYEVKRTVENYILTLPNFKNAHTFLRPVQFMDNYLPDAPFPLRMGRTVVLRLTFYNHPERLHQLISSKDIGIAGAKAFEQGPGFCGGVVRLAGDEMVAKDIERVYKEVIGADIPLVPGLLARVVKTFIPIVRDMVGFFDDHGYNVNIAEVKKEIPELEDFRTFLQRYKAKQKA